MTNPTPRGAKVRQRFDCPACEGSPIEGRCEGFWCRHCDGEGVVSRKKWDAIIMKLKLNGQTVGRTKP